MRGLLAEGFIGRMRNSETEPRWGTAIAGALLIILCWRRVSWVLSETPLGPMLGIWSVYEAANPPLQRNTAVRANRDVLRPCCRKCGNLAARVVA
jgi:hypothetical protein